MKISIGSKIVKGPYGGGNLFVKNLKNHLEQEGHVVIDNLKDFDIDIILLINPLRYSEIATFDEKDVNFYLKFKNSNAIIVQRINECDQRKNTKNVNKRILSVNNSVDYTVFVSNWLKEIFEEEGIKKSNSKVILSGSDEKIFFISRLNNDKNSKFSLVTHHWSSHPNKGFKTYKLIDNLLDSEEWNKRLDFTYIGNLPKNFKFNNVKVFPPMPDYELGDELRKYDGYVTGSLNEPSGNHHIEAAQCGLPILYINSGGIPEYCDGYGVIFEESNFEEKLNYFIQISEEIKHNLVNYPFNSSKMCSEYLSLFESLYRNKQNYIYNRKHKSKLNIILRKAINTIDKRFIKIYIKLINILSNFKNRKVRK